MVGRVPPGAAVSSNISKQHRRVLSTSRCIARGGRLVGCTGRAGAAETGEKPAPASSPGRAPACRLARAQPTQRDCPGRGAPRRRAAAARAVDRAPGARPSGGRRFVWLARCLLAHAVLIAALTLPARFSAAAPHQFTSADGGYSVTFPAAPQEQMNEDERARTVLNALNYDNGYFAVVHVDNKRDLKLNDELEGNITKFTDQLNAPAQLRRKKKVARRAGRRTAGRGVHLRKRGAGRQGDRHRRRPAHLHGRGVRAEAARSQGRRRPLYSVLQI